jgi:hypothetical protein
MVLYDISFHVHIVLWFGFAAISDFFSVISALDSIIHVLIKTMDILLMMEGLNEACGVSLLFGANVGSSGCQIHQEF